MTTVMVRLTRDFLLQIRTDTHSQAILVQGMATGKRKVYKDGRNKPPELETADTRRSCRSLIRADPV